MNTAAPEISTPPSGRSRQVFFQQRPQGEPESSVFGVREHAVPTPADGELLCRNLLLSVDPYLRLKMYSRESYTPPLEIGQAIPGGSIAQVVTSRAEGWSRGQLVAISGGWQDYAVVSASTAKRVDLPYWP
jgi:NADPH-dependent curcumin reductase CurA